MKNTIKIFFFLCFLCMGCEKGGDSVSFESKVYFPAHGKYEIEPLLGESIFELVIYRSGYNTGKTATVVLHSNAQLLGDYSDKQAVELPATMYSIAQENYSFDKDDVEKKVYIHLKNIDESVKGKNYVLPLQIQSDDPSIIEDEKNTVYLHINNYRNQYQGQFRVIGETYLKHNEEETESIDYRTSAMTVSPNIFEIPSHVVGVNLWVEVIGNVVKVKEAQNNNTLQLKDLGSTMTGEFDTSYQRFHGSFNLYFSYESAGRTHEARMTLNFDL